MPRLARDGLLRFARKTWIERNSKSLDHPGVDQKPIKSSRLRAFLAGVEHAVAAKHDLLLLLERRIERDAGGFLDYERDVGRIECIKRGREVPRPVVDAIDRIVGGEVTRIGRHQAFRHL